MNTIANFKSDFPGLKQKIYGHDLVYLDSAATTLKPQIVIDRLNHFNTFEIANIHRGAHYLADKATESFENCRQKVCDFIGANSSNEIIFVKGATEGFNLVSNALGSLLSPGDEIILSELDHHANLVPWQMLAKSKGLVIKVIEVNDSGELQVESIQKLVTNRTKVLALTHCSNSLGTLVDIKPVISFAKKQNIISVIDGAQAIGKVPVSVSDLGCDFYIFSGHKIFAPFGVGIVFGRLSVLESLPPYQGGGAMIQKVTMQESTFADVPFRFEAGTPNVESVIGLSTAIDYINSRSLSTFEEIEGKLLQYATSELKKLEMVEILGPSKLKVPIISFKINGAHPSDIGQILDKQGIAIRAGHHCNQPLMEKLGVVGTARASFSIYNSLEDIDALVAGLNKVKRLLL